MESQYISLKQALEQKEGASALTAAAKAIETLALCLGKEPGQAAALAESVLSCFSVNTDAPEVGQSVVDFVQLLSHVAAPLREARSLTAADRVTERRPEVLECDVVRFQNNKEKWVAFVGLLDGRPYEIFTGLQDDDEGIVLPKTVNKGRIIKTICSDGTKRYDFQFQNKRGYKMTVEGLSEKFNKEYWNYAKLISGVLRYRMPIAHVIRLVDSLQLESESINTWKAGVSRALKKYLAD